VVSADMNRVWDTVKQIEDLFGMKSSVKHITITNQ
jgi:hypothetical protein